MSGAEKSDHHALLRQQTALARFGELALRSDDLDEILTEACRLVGEALGTDLAKVMELQEDGRDPACARRRGLEAGRRGRGDHQGCGRHLGGPRPEDGRADDLSRHREGDAVQVPALPDRQRRQGGRQRRYHRRQGPAAVRHPADRQPRAPPVHRGRHRFPAQLRQPDRGGRGPPPRYGGAARPGGAAAREHRPAGGRVGTGLIGFFEWDVPTDTITARSFASFYGLDPGPVAAGVPLGTVLGLIHPEDRAAVRTMLRDALATLSNYTKEFRLVHPGGEVRWILVRGHCYEHEVGASAPLHRHRRRCHPI